MLRGHTRGELGLFSELRRTENSVGATRFENGEEASAECGQVSLSEDLDGRMGEGDQAGEVEEVERWVPCALKGTAGEPLADPITRALWDALASWSRGQDLDELRRRVLALMSLMA